MDTGPSPARQAEPFGRDASSYPKYSTGRVSTRAKTASSELSLSNKLRPRVTQANLRQGMTLVELLTVIAVISILIGILIPTVSTVRTSARKARIILS